MRPFRAFRPEAVLAFALGLFATLTLSAAPTAEEKAAHALNRLGYGPRPGEVAEVAKVGVENWIRTQLFPDKIPDPAAEAAVAKLTKLTLSQADLVEAYQTEIRERNQLQGAQAKMDFDKRGEG